MRGSLVQTKRYCIAVACPSVSDFGHDRAISEEVVDQVKKQMEMQRGGGTLVI